MYRQGVKMRDNKMVMDRINKLKIIACLLIVLGHSTAIYTGKWVFKSEQTSFFYKNLSIYVSSFHLILFVFASGFIYAYCREKKDKYKSLKELIKIKFKRLIIPYCFVGAFFMIPIGMILNIERYRNSYIINLRSFIVGRNNGHLWFLMMLFILFIIFYMLEKILLSKGKEKILIILMIIANIISTKVPDYFELSNVFYYCIYFYVGYKCYLTSEKGFKKVDIYLNKNRNKVFVFSFVLIAGLLYMVKNLKYYFIFTSMVQKILYFFIGILGVAHIYAFILLIEKYFIINKIIKFIGKHIFNIYLLHEPIIFIILSNINKDRLSPIIVSSTCMLLSVTISTLLSEIYYRIKEIKNERKQNVFLN